MPPPEPQWEVVDRLPGEPPRRSPSPSSKPPAKSPRRRAFWIGLAIGAAAAFLFYPPARSLAAGAARGLLALWWLVLPLLAWRLLARRRRPAGQGPKRR